MKNLSGVSLLRALPTTRRPTEKLPLPTSAPAGRHGGLGASTARSLARRLGLVLHDLGLDTAVPAGWASIDGAAVVFADLDVPAADRLVRHLEDLAADLAETMAEQAAARRDAGAGQGTLAGIEP